MDNSAVKKLFTLLEQFYPNKKPSKNLIAAWSLALEPYPYDAVKAAAVDHARKSKFFPDIQNLTGGLSPATEAAQANADREDRNRPAPWMMPYIRKIAERREEVKACGN